MQEKIGQMLMTGLPGKTIDPEFRKLVETCKIGNVVLFSRNIESKYQLSKLCTEIQSLISRNTGLPAFIAVDQEGGMVSRMPPDGTNIPGAMAIAATGDPGNAGLAGEITARELKAMGINVDIAPVLDINCNRDNPVIGVRSYGDRKETVSGFGIRMMKSLAEGGIMPVIKHFPGHGDTSEDSHLCLPVINKTFEELESNELVPFKDAIKNGAPCVMSAHILFPAIEKENVPATMSRAIITDLLKNKLGFKGLVISDCLEMNAIKEYYGTARGAIEAIKAGIHIVAVSQTMELAEAAAKGIEAAVISGEIPPEVINIAAEKIIGYKKIFAHMDKHELSIVGCDDHRNVVRQMSEQSITLVQSRGGRIPALGDKVLFLGSFSTRSTLASSGLNKDFNFPDYMAERLDGTGMIIPMNPSEKDIGSILNIAPEYDSIVVGTYNGQLNFGQIQLTNLLCGKHRNVIAVALRNPYDTGFINGCAAALAAYEYTPSAFDALVKVLKGEIDPKGTLPVRICLSAAY
jgi:beta-N-acetylhexosaminidase